MIKGALAFCFAAFTFSSTDAAAVAVSLSAMKCLEKKNSTQVSRGIKFLVVLFFLVRFVVWFLHSVTERKMEYATENPVHVQQTQRKMQISSS